MAKKIQLKVLDKRVLEYGIPKLATSGSAAVDLRVLLDEPLTLQPGECQMLSTGLAMYIEDTSYAGVILPRSGLAHKHGIILGNTIGLIDSDYQGELKISCYHRGNSDYTMNPGERIAQLLLLSVERIEFVQVDEFPPSDRGSGGYGHTGTK